MSFAILLKRALIKKSTVKDRNFQRVSPPIERCFAVYATLLFDEEVSYRSRWRTPQYSVFFPDISLSGQQPVRNIVGQMFFSNWVFIILINVQFWKKTSNRILQKGWITSFENNFLRIYRLVGQHQVSLCWNLTWVNQYQYTFF